MPHSKGPSSEEGVTSLADFLLEEALERRFERKRAGVIVDYGLEEIPALIWQCMPSETLLVDVAEPRVRTALHEGASAIGDDRWWCAFQAGSQPAFVFDGLASSPRKDDVGFATEIHADGHFFAGIWTFPEIAKNAAMPEPAIPDFYADAYRDAVYVARRVYEAANYCGALYVTCTMHHSNRLAFVDGYNRILAPAPSRETLRWPVQLHDLADLPRAGTAMAAQLMRIYGRNVPKS